MSHAINQEIQEKCSKKGRECAGLKESFSFGRSAILLAGPTASGKTDLAIRLACMASMPPCVVINADSMQVYRQVPILTGCPTLEQAKRLPHRLFGIVDPSERFSAGRWLGMVKAEIEYARKSGALPLFVGGTGLYFKVLTRGLSRIPRIPERCITYWQKKAREVGTPALHGILSDRDSRMAERVHEHDTQRIVRALSVLEGTGVSLYDWWSQPRDPPLLPLEECTAFFLDLDDIFLRRRINARFDVMLAAGALEEIRALQALGLDSSFPIMRACGVPELLCYLRGWESLSVSVESAKCATWRYAKRQKTWFRGQMAQWSRVIHDPDRPLESEWGVRLSAFLS